jgi:hypothetical protein
VTSPRPTPTPTPAPAAPRISVSRTSGLNPAGATLTVTGSGFDPAIGIYVAVCTSAAPVSGSACVGGADLSGASGSSAWVSSDPPPYGVGLATPFGAGGTFRVTITVPASQGSLDCRTTACGVITRADHTRYGERSQDTFVRITFA